MVSALYANVARKLASESLGLRKGETVTIETWNTGVAFALEMVKEARRIGCTTTVVFEDEKTYLECIKRTPADVLGVMGRHEYALLANSDAYVFVPGPPLSGYHKKISAEERTSSTRYNVSWYDAAKKARLKGARLTFGYVGTDMAGYLGKSVARIVRHQLVASTVDLAEIAAKGRALSSVLKDGADSTITTGSSTLTFRLEGSSEVQDGILDEQDLSEGYNMAYVPPGFVRKDVDQSSIFGAISLSPTLTRLGVVKGAKLEFDAGRLVRWSSRSSQKALDELLGPLPPEKRSFSSITIGLNPRARHGYGIDRLPLGSIGIQVARFLLPGSVARGFLTVDGRRVVADGRLVS